MRGVRGRGEPAGADEEGPHEAGGGRLPDLPASIAARYKAVDVQGVLHEAIRIGEGLTRAVELYERAAELGVTDAHYNLGVLYDEGKEVEKDTAKALRHVEAAAMCGHVNARFRLSATEYNAGNYDLSLQNMMIGVKLGHEDSLNMVKRFFMAGLATKADYASALRGYHNAIEEMSSPDRDEAKALGFEQIHQM
ncbi:hypothetical protein THAOC_35498 [Thalassiosira oceanica]|uniref:Sel1 repeat family protein n=1 Tax=Thalassiosira oceanica TaxID=159749 RepID=K0R0T8_THAOC|nr:hypothetical protein THAOC_35498 [Thalassiosira oceanica]|eukprot:EJK45868.1 hypothetical protein THAOC_35498 [Thalassiosira oceanica]